MSLCSFAALEGQNVGSPKRRVQSQLGRWSCTPPWHEAHFQVKSAKSWGSRTTFRSWDVQKVYAAVARSTCRSQNVQNTAGLDQFWKLRCWKRVRRCGAKHMSKSKVQKTKGYGTLLDDQMSFCLASARDYAPCRKWAKREGFVAVSTTTTSTPHYTTHYTTHYTKLHYTTLHHTTLHDTKCH